MKAKLQMAAIATAVASAPEYEKTVRVGIVQAVVHPTAWDGGSLTMDGEAIKASWAAIQGAFQQFNVLDVDHRPHIVLIPEVTIPRCRLKTLREMAAQLPSLVVGGVDFHLAQSGHVENRAAVLIPSNWPELKPAGTCKCIYVGKTYPSAEEKKLFRKSVPRRTFRGDPTLWLFDAGHLGRFAVCLCFDFMDVERLPLYRGQVQHLFVLAYNRDTATFDHVAESLCRTLYCNVVVCNTGYFGGSTAIAPLARHYRRPLYRVQGQRVSTSQIVQLPVKVLAGAQLHGKLGKKNSYDELKALPPGLPI